MRLHNGHLSCAYFENISPCFQNQVNFFFKTSLFFFFSNTHLLHPTKFRDRVPRQAVPGRCLWSSAADQWDLWPAAISTPMSWRAPFRKKYSQYSQYMDVAKNRGYPQKIIHFNRVFHYKPSILGYPYFWKHLYGKTEAGKSTVCLTFLALMSCADFSCLDGFSWVFAQKILPY